MSEAQTSPNAEYGMHWNSAARKSYPQYSDSARAPHASHVHNLAYTEQHLLRKERRPDAFSPALSMWESYSYPKSLSALAFDVTIFHLKQNPSRQHSTVSSYCFSWTSNPITRPVSHYYRMCGFIFFSGFHNLWSIMV